MWEKTLILLALFSGTLAFSTAAIHPQVAYCEHQGYDFEGGNCTFKDGLSCKAEAFYNGTCGQNYRKNISCREKGETVVPEIEKCCEGLKPYQPHKGPQVKVGGQECVSTGFLATITRFLNSLPLIHYLIT